MRLIMALSLLIMPIAATVACRESTDSLTTKVDQLVDERIVVLERKWKIAFNPALRPRIVIGKTVHQKYMSGNQFAGLYYSDSLLISIALPVENQDWPVVETLDHELIHAFCDQVSRRLGRGAWPNPTEFNTYSVAEKAALRLQTEGLATAAVPGEAAIVRKLWQEYLPKTPELCFVPGNIGNKYTYTGGRALIQPLVDAVGLEAAIVYVITHPIDVNDRPFKAALIHWAEQAYRDLKIEPIP